MDRNSLHRLIDRIPDADLLAARRFLEYLAVSPALRAVQTATLDDEEVTRADEESMARAQADIEAGRVTSHEEVLREFGLR
jgi:predicted transcriptional regulator